MRVALGFFGITRSLKYTIDSIKTNIMNVLESNDVQYDVFVHTYSLTTYKNFRTNESINIVDNDEYKLLNSDFVEIDEQEQIKKIINMQLYRTHVDPWNTNYNSVDNFILAQYSKARLVKMIQTSNNEYDYILFMRPDCKYTEPFDIKFFSSISDSSICIPDFHLNGPYKFNDRFCIANMRTYKLYGDIFEILLPMSKRMPLHSETIIGEIMNLRKLRINRIPFRFSRVRCSGLVLDDK